MNKLNVKSKTGRLTLSAVMIALSTVLSLIPVITLPFGGSVTVLSMLPVMLLPLIYGEKWGFFACFVNSIMQLLLDIGKVFSWGLSPVTLVACMLLDYIFAFTLLGLAGMWRKRGTAGIILGSLLALVCRLLMHFISGVFLFGNFEDGVLACLRYSINYNSMYMVPEMVTTTAALVLLTRNRTFMRLIEDNQI